MAFTIEADVVVDRDLEEAFAYLDDDIATFAEWRRPPWMRLRRLTDGPVGVGTRYETSLRILGVAQGPIVTEVTAYDPPRHLQWRARTPTSLLEEVGGEYLLDKTARGTSVTITGQVQLRRALRLLEPVARIVFSTMYLDPMMRRLKTAIEDRPD